MTKLQILFIYHSKMKSTVYDKNINKYDFKYDSTHSTLPRKWKKIKVLAQGFSYHYVLGKNS